MAHAGETRVAEGAADLLDRVRGYALPASARGRGTWIRQRGTLLRGKRWLRFQAEQRFDAVDIGFDWKAQVRMGPVALTVRDSFRNGEGGLEIRLLSIRLASSRGEQMAQAQVQRFLAELPWCPVALENPLLRWSAPNSEALEVSMPVGQESATVRVVVEGDGRVRRSEATRQRQVGKRYELTEWFGEFSGYQEMGGMRLPTRAEVAWVLPDGVQAYWRGEVVAAGITP